MIMGLLLLPLASICCCLGNFVLYFYGCLGELIISYPGAYQLVVLFSTLFLLQSASPQLLR